MRATLVRCCDYHPAEPCHGHRYGWLSLPASLSPFGGSGLADALADAVEHDHPACDSASCDIAAALDAGFPFAAYWLLSGATETPGCDAFIDACAAQWGWDAVRAALGTNLYDCPDWQPWEIYFREHGRRCDACGTFTFASDGWEPEECGNCLAALPTEGYVSAAAAQYAETLVWQALHYADSDSEPVPLDSVAGVEDLSDDALEEIRDDCRSFILSNYADTIGADMEAEQCGHDFMLTRNGHGAGFWDRGLGERGDRLTASAEAWGTADVYLSADGSLELA